MHSTIADLAGSEEIGSVHLVEALHAHLHCDEHTVPVQVSQSPEVDDDLRIDPKFGSKASDNP